MALTTQEIQSILSDELNILAKRFNTGTMNPQTVAAIKELQAFLKIPVTGISDDTTYKVLDQLWNKDRRTSLFHHFNPSAVKTDIKDKNKIFAIQDILIKYKIFSPKNRTGIYDQQTFEAVKILQKILKLKPTGIFDQELQSEINKNPGAIIDAVKPYNLSDPSGGGILWKSIQQKLDVNKLPSENSFLIYDGNYLCWVSNNRIVQKWRALSGSIPWRELEPKQTKKAPGGLPPGRYGIGQIQEMKYKMSDYSVFDLLKYDNRRLFYSEPETHSIIDFTTQQKNILTHIGWGNWRIPIIGKRFGRGSFYIHGGGIVSSAGCIDIGDQGMENFSQVFAKTFGSKKHSLFLLVFYGSTAEEILNNNQLLSALKNATKDQDSEILISKGEELINQAKTKQAAEAAAKAKQAAEAAAKAKKAAEQKKIEKKKREEDQRRAEEQRKAEEEKNSFWGRIKGLAGLS